MLENGYLKDDKLFCEALLSRLRADAVFLRELEERFLNSGREKDKRKAFGVRPMRWLTQRAPDVEQRSDLLEEGSTPFVTGSAEHELQMILRWSYEREEKAHGSGDTMGRGSW